MTKLIEVAEKIAALRIEIIALIDEAYAADTSFDYVAVRKKATEYIMRMDDQLLELISLSSTTEQDLTEIISLCANCRAVLRRVTIIIPTN